MSLWNRLNYFWKGSQCLLKWSNFNIQYYLSSSMFLIWFYYSQMLNHDTWISDTMGTMSHMRPSRDKQVVVPIHNVRWNSKSRLFIQHLAYERKHINSHMKGNNTLVSCAKTAEPINTSKSGDGGFYWSWNELRPYSFFFVDFCLNEKSLILLFGLSVIIFLVIYFKCFF